MNKLIIYVDEREFLENESKNRVVIETYMDKSDINETEEYELVKSQELYLNFKSIDVLKESGKFIVEEKTFSDKILDEFNKTKPEFCKD